MVLGLVGAGGTQCLGRALSSAAAPVRSLSKQAAVPWLPPEAGPLATPGAHVLLRPRSVLVPTDLAHGGHCAPPARAAGAEGMDRCPRAEPLSQWLTLETGVAPSCLRGLPSASSGISRRRSNSLRSKCNGGARCQAGRRHTVAETRPSSHHHRQNQTVPVGVQCAHSAWQGLCWGRWTDTPKLASCKWDISKTAVDEPGHAIKRAHGDGQLR